MLAEAKRIYFATRKRHDQLFNVYVMRPLAAGVVAVLARTPATPNQITILNLALFIVSAGMLIGLEGYAGALASIAVLEVSYMFDCADGMLARHKKIASKAGHLFDFFTDEIKALLLVSALGLRMWRFGGVTPWQTALQADFVLVATLAGAVILASATSLTNFVRRPEISGQETPVEAHYETVSETTPKSLIGRIAGFVMTFLRFLNHYPSHIWIFALAAQLDLFFWIYIAINSLYLAKGWLGLLLRFGRG